ncbi:hypothetical protein [Variovorax rhizosphaerae]|uniref:Uncharacterized protein n=1 Tax=Variovorax rhizosphaerae TaxID=1836200 RepID=A0ABU8WLB5_9BURK
MPYTHFQFIAYQVPTAAHGRVTRAMVPAFEPGTEIAAERFAPIRVEDSLPDDARIRLKRLAAAVKSASNNLKKGVKDAPNVLKVFVVPEFYFRPSGTRHCTYSYDDATRLFEQMDVMFVDPEFKDWLFVLGTVMWHMDEKRHWDEETQQWVEGKAHYRNSAVYVRGNQAPDSLRIIEKEVPSRLDGVPNPYVNDGAGYDPSTQQVFTDWLFRKSHVFDVGGVTCGLEICLDHAYSNHDPIGGNHRVLKNVLRDWPVVPAPDVKLHVLTAGGMKIAPQSVAAMPSGFILRNDGYSGDPQTELRSIGLYRRSVEFSSVVPASDLRGVANLKVIPQVGFLGFPDDQQIPIDGTQYSSFDQGLKFFPVQKLPR